MWARKERSNPKHIVITHGLAGGSGSGMVLPVLQQTRRTFGQDTVIWVVSVGEGASEARSILRSILHSLLVIYCKQHMMAYMLFTSP